eukprot:GHVP01005113.1.p2 GENE.GHVP01005113.1~~GHVP01005113.1.p2  ORF type:complete len:409 (+),score=54.78 GHVP01005113.1:75-1301(+)
MNNNQKGAFTNHPTQTTYTAPCVSMKLHSLQRPFLDSSKWPIFTDSLISSNVLQPTEHMKNEYFWQAEMNEWLAISDDKEDLALGLGDHFVGFIRITNNLGHPALNVTCLVTAESGNEQKKLNDTSSNPRNVFAPKTSFSFPIEFRISNLGESRINCIVNYQVSALSDAKISREYFSFVAYNRFTTKLDMEISGTRAYLQIAVTNDSCPCFLNEITPVPTPGLTWTQISPNTNCEPLQSLVRPERFLNTSDVLFLFFIVEPKERSHANVKEMSQFGHLRVMWTGLNGFRGTNTLCSADNIKLSLPKYESIEVTKVDCPTYVQTMSPFSVKVEIQNKTQQQLAHLNVEFDHSRCSPAVVCLNKLPLLVVTAEAYSTSEFELRLIASSPGLHHVDGFSIQDSLTFDLCSG